MDEHGALQVVERYFACLNADHWVGMRELWHPDGERKVPGSRRRHASTR